MRDAVIYYMGPSPAREGRPIGSAGPTTASRMDKYTPQLLDLGLKGMIGKGKRTQDVKDAMVRNHGVYFAAVGGAGALLSQCIRSAQVVAYEDLGTEAIRKLEVERLPVIVVADSYGGDLYETAVQQYRKEWLSGKLESRQERSEKKQLSGDGFPQPLKILEQLRESNAEKNNSKKVLTIHQPWDII